MHLLQYFVRKYSSIISPSFIIRPKNRNSLFGNVQLPLFSKKSRFFLGKREARRYFRKSMWIVLDDYEIVKFSDFKA